MLIAGPVAAQAATKDVTAGTPLAAQKELGKKYSSDANAFFPNKITIAAGDKIRFNLTGFHNVHFPKRGGGPVALIIPSGQKAAGLADAAGAPFWFNGLDVLGFNPVLGKSSFGKTVSFSGAKAVNSGLPAEGTQKPKPFSVKFTKGGTFTYLCDIHPGMKATVKVVRKGAAVPSAAADAKAVKAQVAAAIATAKALAKETFPANTMSVGVAGKGGVERFVFAPEKLTVAPGTTVKFAMSPGSFEIHTATTGPGNPEQATTYLGQIAAAFQKPVVDPVTGVYPSDPPGTVAGLTPATHGNGFWNSGVIDVFSATPSPADSSVRFDGPGTYDFYCLVHPFMKGTVTVQ
jgi:plastocyanin